MTDEERRKKILRDFQEMELYIQLHEHPIETFVRRETAKMCEHYRREEQKRRRFGKRKFIMVT